MDDFGVWHSAMIRNLNETRLEDKNCVNYLSLNIELKGEAFLAIKNFQTHLIYEDLNGTMTTTTVETIIPGPSTTSTEPPVLPPVTPESPVPIVVGDPTPEPPIPPQRRQADHPVSIVSETFSCRNKTECDEYFLLTSGISWSFGGVKPDGTYKRPESQTIGNQRPSITISCYNMNQANNFSDAEFRFQYFINEDEGRLFINDDNKLDKRPDELVLHKTIDVASKKIVYQEAIFRFSDFHPSDGKMNTDAQRIYIVPDFNDDTLVAIKQTPSFTLFDNTNEVLNRKDFLITTKEETGLESWNRTKLPSERFLFNPNEIVFKAENIAEDTDYSIVSPWIKSTGNPLELEFDYELTSSTSGYNESYNIRVDVFEFQSDEQIEIQNQDIPSVSAGSKGNKTLIIPESSTGKMRRLVVSFRSDSNSSTSKIIIQNLHFGDACQDPDVCDSKNLGSQCIRQSAGVKICKCDRRLRGPLCQEDEHCEQQRFKELSGYEWCKNNGSAVREFCESRSTQYRNGMKWNCICDDGHYWDVNEFKCMQFSECSKVLKCPEENTVCVEDNFNKGNPCPKCKEGYEKGKDGKCVEIDVCSRDCGQMKCTKITEDRKPSVARCYCELSMS